MKRRDFIKTCAIGMCGSFVGSESLAGSLRLLKRKNDVISKYDNIPYYWHVEIHLTEHCNLNCKYCSHLSPIAEESFYDVKQYEKDMEALANAMTGGRLRHLQLLGGEPLLHPDINKILEISAKYMPTTDIDMLTNGVLLDNMEPDFWKTLADNNIVICPSIYPIKLNWDSILNKAKKYGVEVMHDGRDYKIGKREVSHPIKKFYKVDLDLEGKQTTKQPNCKFSGCCNYINGKLYRCFLASNIIHFNKKFGTNLEVTEDDYADIYKINDINKLFAYSEKWKENYPFCRYCKSIGEKYVKWECSDKHDISEWT